MSFPDKDKRLKCWESRDLYWKCLDERAPKHNSTSGENVPEACKQFRKLFEKDCPKLWVVHFDRKRTYEQFKERLAQGHDPLNESKERKTPA